MSPRTVTHPLLRDTPILRVTDNVADATRSLLDADLPALPVVDERDGLYGIFGEREFTDRAVADDGKVIGVITRADFFRSVAERFLSI